VAKRLLIERAATLNASSELKEKARAEIIGLKVALGFFALFQ